VPCFLDVKNPGRISYPKKSKGNDNTRINKLPLQQRSETLSYVFFPKIWAVELFMVTRFNLSDHHCNYIKYSSKYPLEEERSG